MGVRCNRTHSKDPDFLKLVRELNAELAVRDGADHAFYSQYNTLDAIQHVVLAYMGDRAVGCGAFKPFDAQTLEIKRMYVVTEARSKGVASAILSELEHWGIELGYTSGVLETGKRNPEAVNLYKKYGYERIENFGPYRGVDNSLCFRKML